MNPDSTPEKKQQYKARLSSMTDQDLLQETQSKIWLSAFANNNPRSCYHWQADACYDACKERSKPEIYTEAFNNASRK